MHQAKYDYRKTRAIVVMFNHYPDKLLVKQKAQDAKRIRILGMQMDETVTNWNQL